MTAKTSFQALPQCAPGLTEYTVEIDGQLLRYRTTAAAWNSFCWPHPTGTPGVRIAGITLDGRTVELLNVPGRFGLQRMFEAAQRRKLPDGSHEMTWAHDGAAVTLHLRVISQPGATTTTAAAAAGSGGLRGLRLPAAVVGRDGAQSATVAAPAAALTAGMSTAGSNR